MKKIPVLVYTDIGDDIDDSLAITYLVQCPDIDLLGIICDHKQPRQSVATAKKLLQIVKSETPILGSRHETFLKKIFTTYDKEICILSIGPTKQLSKDIYTYKKLFLGCKRIYFQGHVFVDRTTVVADLQSYNFAQEPAAIQSILSYDIPKTFVGKYAAYDIPFTKKDFEILSQCKPTIRKTLYRRAKQWKIRFKKLSPEVWERIYGKDQNIISYPYDLITAVSIVREDMFVKQKIGNLELIGQKPLPIAIKNIPACKKHIFTIFKK